MEIHVMLNGSLSTEHLQGGVSGTLAGWCSLVLNTCRVVSISVSTSTSDAGSVVHVTRTGLKLWKLVGRLRDNGFNTCKVVCDERHTHSIPLQ